MVQIESLIRIERIVNLSDAFSSCYILCYFV